MYPRLSACFPLLLATPALLVTTALLLGHTDSTARSGPFGLTSPSLTRFTDSPSPPSADPTAAPHLGALFSLMTERSHFGQAGALMWGPGEVISSPASAQCSRQGLVPAVRGQVITAWSVVPAFLGLSVTLHMSMQSVCSRCPGKTEHAGKGRSTSIDACL